eukprot:UN16588
MLPKKSTSVNQNLESASIHFQLSVAIFRTARNRLVAEKLLYIKNVPKNVDERR